MKKYCFLYIILSFIAFNICGCTHENEALECSFLDNPNLGTAQSHAKAFGAVGLSNLYKVTDDIYRSSQPQEGGMTSAKGLGIKTVLSLRETEADLDMELDRKENTALNLVHIPMVTSDITDKDIMDALRVIKDAPKPILVHCKHGSDRTGLIIAMYRIVFLGWPKSCAKDEMINGSFGFHSILTNIPKLIDEADITAIQKELFGDVEYEL